MCGCLSSHSNTDSAFYPATSTRYTSRNHQVTSHHGSRMRCLSCGRDSLDCAKHRRHRAQQTPRTAPHRQRQRQRRRLGRPLHHGLRECQDPTSPQSTNQQRLPGGALEINCHTHSLHPRCPLKVLMTRMQSGPVNPFPPLAAIYPKTTQSRLKFKVCKRPRRCVRSLKSTEASA